MLLSELLHWNVAPLLAAGARGPWLPWRSWPGPTCSTWSSSPCSWTWSCGYRVATVWACCSWARSTVWRWRPLRAEGLRPRLRPRVLGVPVLNFAYTTLSAHPWIDFLGCFALFRFLVRGGVTGPPWGSTRWCTRSVSSRSRCPVPPGRPFPGRLPWGSCRPRSSCTGSSSFTVPRPGGTPPRARRPEAHPRGLDPGPLPRALRTRAVFWAVRLTAEGRPGAFLLLLAVGGLYAGLLALHVRTRPGPAFSFYETAFPPATPCDPGTWPGRRSSPPRPWWPSGSWSRSCASRRSSGCSACSSSSWAPSPPPRSRGRGRPHRTRVACPGRPGLPPSLHGLTRAAGPRRALRLLVHVHDARGAPLTVRRPGAARTRGARPAC